MLLAIPGTDIHPHAAPMERACQFRHKCFVDDRDWWDLDRAGGNHTVHRICLRDEDIGYQRLLPTTRPHLLTDNLADLCWKLPPTDQRIFEWTRFCIAPGWRDTRRKRDGLVLELAQGVVEWALAHRVDTVTVAIDGRLMAIAMQLRFFVQALGFPKKIGREEVVTLRISFNRETLQTIQEARGSEAPVLREAALATAA